MLSYHMDPATGILEVTEMLMSARDTKTSYWYYDTKRWLSSGHGKKGDAPVRPMRAEEIEWVKTHYLPKVQNAASAA